MSGLPSADHGVADPVSNNGGQAPPASALVNSSSPVSSLSPVEEHKEDEFRGLVGDPERNSSLSNIDSTGARNKTDSKEIALVNRLDGRLLPVLTIMYYLNFIDRAALPNARLGGIEHSLSITPTQYVSTI